MKKVIFLLAALLASGTLQAGVIVDSLDNTDNISYTFGAASVSDNGGSGIVTLQKTSTNYVDTGMDWQLGGASGGSMDINAYTSASITPEGPVNGGYYNVNILLYDALGDYIAEQAWITDTQDTETQTVVLADLINASAYAESGVASWALRIRANLPHDVENSGFGFTEIAVNNIPEPVSLALIGIFGGGALFVRRLLM
ncbi:hypothetical protein [Pontiella agarivorans]|uniref:PEP-CTERM protein-sorting domain-containing protein n=1 Tax=Pontiella agarivorans TaxID=3038953 RepID=A0ABU5N220_9BACT|nr:hypothetical protein [Pontiella agarivorans]MDZ8120495.1 hypothetical protein [Pontiella agarivorans]